MSHINDSLLAPHSPKPLHLFNLGILSLNNPLRQDISTWENRVSIVQLCVLNLLIYRKKPAAVAATTVPLMLLMLLLFLLLLLLFYGCCCCCYLDFTHADYCH